MKHVVRRKSKYGNKKVTIDGKTFDSRAEAKDYLTLTTLQTAYKITDLELQPKYDLLVNGTKIGTYRADFKFYDVERDEWRVVDRKGYDTPLSKRSRKHVKAQYGIEVEIWK